jgi:hypothetical protein
VPAVRSSYACLLRDRRTGPFLLGVLLSSTGDGMVLTALPIQALRIHGRLPAGPAIGFVQFSPYVLAAPLAFAIAMRMSSLAPRRVLLADSGLRGVTFAMIGWLSLDHALTLPVLLAALAGGSVLRMVALSCERVALTGLAGASNRAAANAALTVVINLALFVIGPALGGAVAATSGPGWTFVADALTFAVQGMVAFATVRLPPSAAAAAPPPPTGWKALSQQPVALRMFAVTILFNLLYMTVEVALPLLALHSLSGSGGTLGIMWSVLGAGTLAGAALSPRLRVRRAAPMMAAIVAGWGGAVVLLAAAPDVAVALLALAVGGLIYGPYTPLAYTRLQSVIPPASEVAAVTAWTAGVTTAMPLGLLVGGPLATAGAREALLISGVLTVALAVWAFRVLSPAQAARRSIGATSETSGLPRR